MPGAQVSRKRGAPPGSPDNAYCYEGEDMTGKYAGKSVTMYKSDT